MFKIIFALYLIFAAAKAEVEYLKGYSTPELHFDDYISLHRQQYAKVIKNYDAILENFRERYLARLDIITVQLELLTDVVVRNEQYLYPLELVSEVHRKCISKYRPDLPAWDYPKNEVARCGADLYDKSESIIYKPFKIRNILQEYYESIFEEEIKDCAKNHYSVKDYEKCIFYVVHNTNIYINENKESFTVQMDAAECDAKANIRQAYRCNFRVQSYATSKISEANVLIKNCIDNKYRCEPCEYNCSEIRYVNKDYMNKTMLNPLNEYDHNVKCVMLQVIN